MCGIAGFFHTERGREAETPRLAAMCDVITHRGPDSDGLLCRDGVGLGMRRLKIIDLESGDQPIFNRDRTVAVTFNGEIYNYRELRKELELDGFEFRTNSDTEVLVHLYDKLGSELLHRLNGMFGFAIADFRERKVLLARDRLGIKPLFFTQANGTWFWGSEIKSLLQNGDVARRVDVENLRDYLGLNYVPPGATLFEGIEQLLPGELAEIDANGMRRRTWWTLKFDPRTNMTEQEAIERSRELFEDAVRMRLVADVPFGAFLSGGIDSSAVVAFMAKHLSQPVKTFSIGFGEREFNELPYARQVAEQYGTEHHELFVEPEIETVLPELVWHSEEPTADSSAIPVYYVSKLAREHVTMVLSGDGGDELFAGYETYNAHYVREMYRRVPGPLRRHVIAPFVNALPVSSGKVSFEFKAKRFVKGAELGADEAHFFWRSIFSEEAKRELLGDNGTPHPSTFDRHAHYFDESGTQDPLSRMLYVDTRFYLPSDMLIKVDRMSMANSLEARVPFLDHRLVEFAATIPSEIKFRNKVKKYVLKKALEPHLSHDILYRKKAGFNVPKNVWLRGPLRPMMEELLSASRLSEHGLFDPKMVARLMHEHTQKKADHSFQIWSLLIFQLWYDRFFSRAALVAK